MNNNNNNNNKEDDSPPPLRRRLRQRIFQRLLRVLKKTKPLVAAILTLVVVHVASRAADTTSTSGTITPLFQPPPAEASMPLAKLGMKVDPAGDAMAKIKSELEQARVKQRQELDQKFLRIEQQHGSKARLQAEKQHAREQTARDEQLQKDVAQLERELLDQGICPFTDEEGFRQSFLLRTGKDLADYDGTDQAKNRMFEQRGMPELTFGEQKKVQRQIIKLKVQDLKNRGIDPLEYYQVPEHQNENADILFLYKTAAEKKLAEYQANMEEYGQILKPRPGQLSVKEKRAQDPEYEAKRLAKEKEQEEANELQLKEEAKAAKEQAKADAKAAKEKAKAEAKAKAAEEKAAKKAEKERLKEEKRLKKEAEKAAKAAAAAAVATTGAAVSTATAGVTGIAADLTESAIDSATTDSSSSSSVADTAAQSPGEESSGETVSLTDFEDDTKFQGDDDVVIQSEKKSSFPFVKAAVGAAVVVGAGRTVLQRINEGPAMDEEERQRQFKMLMGIDNDDAKSSDVSAIDVDSTILDLNIDGDDDDNEGDVPEVPESSSSSEDATTEPEEPVVPVKKKKSGLGRMKSMFSKSQNTRETDLMVLVSEGATAPELAKMLAKLLTFGAPGRFPLVSSLPGDTPMEKFDLEKAVEMLKGAVSDAGITKEEGAEVFANVVNAMMIDIIDLASTSLKEKDEMTFDAVNIVVDFMNHAASLYDAVAEGVVITPVTYGGTLPKAKIEQLYSTYAYVGGMTKALEPDMDNRIDLVRNVFGISEKKAEGLAMRAMQKNMMEMMKSDEGREQMAEMMQNMMGGLEGMEGMEGMGDMMNMMSGLGGAGEGGEPDIDQLKQMLKSVKSMKDAGAIPPEEFATVREQFRESFGSSIDEIMKQAEEGGVDSLSEVDQELLELMKSILD